MKCAIMQPTFLPWAGYFNLMAQVDHFVFLDDVQLDKHSWQTRNRLLINGRVQLISLPVRNIKQSQIINETEALDVDRWGEKLGRAFDQNYGKHPHYIVAREVLDLLTIQPGAMLSTLNESVIRHVAERLGITARLHRAAELGITGIRSERLIALCEHFDVQEYVSPVGSADYLAEDGFAAKANAKLRFQDYQPQPYFQKNSREFFSHLSIIDVIANLGWDGSRKYVTKGIC